MSNLNEQARRYYQRLTEAYPSLQNSVELAKTSNGTTYILVQTVFPEVNKEYVSECMPVNADRDFENHLKGVEFLLRRYQ